MERLVPILINREVIFFTFFFFEGIKIPFSTSFFLRAVFLTPVKKSVMGIVLAFPFAPSISQSASKATNAHAISPEGDAVQRFPPIVATCLICVEARLNAASRSEEHTSELQSLRHLVCRL